MCCHSNYRGDLGPGNWCATCPNGLSKEWVHRSGNRSNNARLGRHVQGLVLMNGVQFSTMTIGLTIVHWAVFSYKLRYIVGFWLVEMAISINQKPTIYRNLYEKTGPQPRAASRAYFGPLFQCWPDFVGISFSLVTRVQGLPWSCAGNLYHLYCSRAWLETWFTLDVLSGQTAARWTCRHLAVAQNASWCFIITAPVSFSIAEIIACHGFKHGPASHALSHGCGDVCRTSNLLKTLRYDIL